MKLTNNFSLKEFIESRFYDVKTQKKVWESYEKDKDELLPEIQKLANQLQFIRDYLDAPVNINIAYRPKWYEISKGRKGNSQHCLGKACDIHTEETNPLDLYSLIEDLISKGEILQGGLGKYSTFTHYDIRKTKARW
jgi:uncharacterized protein YcbK (DUF882 family)